METKGRNKNGRISKKALRWMEGHREVMEEFFYRNHVKVTGAEHTKATAGGKLELPLTEVIFAPDNVEFRFYARSIPEILSGKIPLRMEVGGKVRKIKGLVKGQFSSIFPGDSLMVYWCWWAESWISRLRRKVWDRRAILQD